MDALPVVLREGRGAVHVSRGANITASQEANRKTFLSANKSLDRFIEDTGFELRLFIEHAIGRGEATRQRFERSGDESVRYFGADLEDPAIDAAQAEQAAGFLPSGMGFVRHADIGEPSALIRAIEAAGLAVPCAESKVTAFAKNPAFRALGTLMLARLARDAAAASNGGAGAAAGNGAAAAAGRGVKRRFDEHFGAPYLADVPKLTELTVTLRCEPNPPQQAEGGE